MDRLERHCLKTMKKGILHNLRPLIKHLASCKGLLVVMALHVAIQPLSDTWNPSD